MGRPPRLATVPRQDILIIAVGDDESDGGRRKGRGYKYQAHNIM